VKMIKIIVGVRFLLKQFFVIYAIYFSAELA